ncbi:hypothetical protein CVT24_002113 [Panaeolus cyanescens]|uniref:Nephrocystin 3-like N-terminal domain-containing protein n=1 Tax=Panaeolus cyanescens TaxID=181874 RepID=A0A409WV67_9AGAR|nr:hypothetical protein CVT24_002113 [Panaeolus cyanescens]
MASPEASNNNPKSFPILQWWKTFHGDNLSKFPSQKQSLAPKHSESERSTGDGIERVIAKDDGVQSSNSYSNALQTDKQELAPSEGPRDNSIKSGNQPPQVGEDQSSAMFGAGAKLLIHGGNPTFQHNVFNINHGQDASNSADLYSRSAPSAAFNSKDRYEPPHCHPETRVTFLKMVEEWAEKGPLPLTWIHGPAGVGKSAIAQTTAETLHKGGKLAASFFFSKSAPPESQRGHEGRFVTTLAQQLTESIPGLRKLVQDVVENKPSMFDLNLSQQVMEMILEPMKQLQHGRIMPRLTGSLPNVIVVDGLDKCQGEAGQKQVLDAIATLVQHPDIFKFSVLLFSRSELTIRSWFALLNNKPERLVNTVPLLYHCNNDDDIRIFVLDEISTICKTHPLKIQLPPSWPSSNDVDTIVKRASGQFIYATTIIKYINDPRHHPCRRLEYIIHNTIPDSDQPYTPLDVLYLTILRNTQHPNHVRLLLCFCIVSVRFIGWVDAKSFLVFLESLFALPCPVITLVTDLQSILVDMERDPYVIYPRLPLDICIYGADTVFIPGTFHHASLLEFLLDPQRSLEFHVDVQQFELQLFDLILKNLQDPRRQQSLTSDEEYCFVVYSFVLMLQIRSSSLPSSSHYLATELTKWDALDDDILYCILEVLCQDLSPFRIEVKIAEFNKLLQPTTSTRTIFAKAVERKIMQCYNILSCENIPLELFLLLYGGPFLSLPNPGAKAPLLETGSLDLHSTFIFSLDPALVTQNFVKPEDLEVIAAIDISFRRMQWKGSFADGDQRPYVVLFLLHKLGPFLWSHVPISATIVSALEELASCCFSAPALASLNRAAPTLTLPKSEGTPWESFAASPCLPLFWLAQHPFAAGSSDKSRCISTLGLLHDYIRLYYLYADKQSEEAFLDKPARSLALQTKNTETGRNIDLDEWSSNSRISRLVSVLREKRRNNTGVMYYWDMFQRLWYKFYRPDEFAAEEMLVKYWQGS